LYRNVSCPICNKFFYTDETLKCHLISHYDIKYWSCGICAKNFKRIKNVKYHLKNAHGLAEALDIKKHCVKLRKAPTKAEIEMMGAASAKEGEHQDTLHTQLEGAMGAGQKQPEFIDLTEFKTTLTATFILPDT
jgi:hypothetical protein